jgi:hypothetical protein
MCDIICVDKNSNQGHVKMGVDCNNAIHLLNGSEEGT